MFVFFFFFLGIFSNSVLLRWIYGVVWWLLGEVTVSMKHIT